jgi:H+/gluconate symporter-like permease
MDALPRTPQIQNIIPTTFFNTTKGAAPWFGTIGTIYIAVAGTAYLHWQVNRAEGGG